MRKGKGVQRIGLRESGVLAQRQFQTFAQLGGGAARKGNGKDVFGRHAIPQKPLHAAHERARLARTGPGEDEYRMRPRVDGLHLGGGIGERRGIGRDSRSGRGSHRREKGNLPGGVVRARCAFGFASGLFAFREHVKER